VIKRITWFSNDLIDAMLGDINNRYFLFMFVSSNMADMLSPLNLSEEVTFDINILTWLRGLRVKIVIVFSDVSE